jgi:bacterioferritin-associated ferredoxin
MYVCICKSVRERQVRELVREHGCDYEGVVSKTGAGSDCGSCQFRVAQLVRHAENDEPKTPAVGSDNFLSRSHS